MTKLIILTGSELRHDFIRTYIASSPDVEVITSYCEGAERSLKALTEEKTEHNDARLRHLSAREQSERDFFQLYIDMTTDRSNPVYIAKGAINDDRYVREIIKRQPDLVIAYGCSIITEKLLSAFSGRFINVHLGLSPYYRGSGTNFWPLVNAEPEFIGATFIHIDAGIDTGEIIHQIRPHIEVGDTPVQIGNRLIVAIAEEYLSIVNCFDGLSP